MKKLFYRTVAFAALLLTFAFAVVSCTGNKENAQEQNTSAPTSATEATEALPNAPEVFFGSDMLLFENSAYTCNIICSDKATDEEKTIYNKIRNELKSITGIMPQYATDFVAYNEDGSKRNAPAILVGETNYEESREVYSELHYSSGAIKLVDNKLVIAFSSLEDGEKIFSRFEALLQNAAKEKLSVDLSSLPIAEVSNPALAKIPVFPNKIARTEDCGDDTYFVRISDVSTEDFETYKQMIADEGYTLSNTREVPGNLYATFLKDDIYVYVYHRASSQSIRVIVGPTDHMPDPPAETKPEPITTPSLTLLGQAYSDIGLGMLYRLPDGKFVVLDGGSDYSKDFVYKALKQEAVTEKITIAAWFLTHSHVDHYDAFIDFVENHGDEIAIETMVFNFTSFEKYQGIKGEETNSSMLMIREFIEENLPDAKVVKPHSGQVLEFGGIPFEIMYTFEDFYVTEFDFLNDTSLVVRAFVDGNSILMLADATYTVGIIMIEAYRDYLKSDMVQLAHHGIWASVDRLYGYVDADVLFWPSNSANAKKWLTDGAVRAAIAPATDIYLPGPSSITIDFPYEFKYNKAEFIAEHT